MSAGDVPASAAAERIRAVNSSIIASRARPRPSISWTHSTARSRISSNCCSSAPGFELEQVVTMQVSLPTARYEEGEQIPFYQALHEKVATIPGVSAAGAINILPLSQNYSSDGFQIEARPAPEGESPAAEARSVANDYFDVMSIRKHIENLRARKSISLGLRKNLRISCKRARVT